MALFEKPNRVCLCADFMLCFTSFTIVLALGGGPQNSTLEVAIYQAIFFEFDLPKAALLR